MTIAKDKETAPKAHGSLANPAKAMQDMMDTIDALRVVYVEETLALKASDTPAFFALQDKKINAAQKYHESLSAFVTRKDDALAVHPDFKTLLRKKQAEFTEIADQNRDALDRMRRTVDRLGGRIMQAARDSAARESASYSAQGSMTPYRNKPVTMGLNESA